MGRTQGRNSRDEHVIPSVPDQGTTRPDRPPGLWAQLLLECFYFVSAMGSFVAAMLGIPWWWLALYALAWMVAGCFRIKIISGREAFIRDLQRRLDQQHRDRMEAAQLRADLITSNPSLGIPPDLVYLPPNPDDHGLMQLMPGRATTLDPRRVRRVWRADFYDGPLGGESTTFDADKRGLPPLVWVHEHLGELRHLDQGAIVPRSYYKLLDLRPLERIAFYELRDAPVAVTHEDYRRWRDVLEQS